MIILLCMVLIIPDNSVIICCIFCILAHALTILEYSFSVLIFLFVLKYRSKLVFVYKTTILGLYRGLLISLCSL